MDNEIIRTGLHAINMIGTAAIGIWLYLEKRSDKTNERVTELSEKVEQLDKDVSSLQASFDGAPNHDHLARVYESVNKLAEKVNQLVGESHDQSNTLRLILNRIIEKGMP